MNDRQNQTDEERPAIQPEEPETAPKKSVKERVFTILSVFFFSVAAVSFLVMVYLNTAKDLTFSPFVSPYLVLAFGGGIGLGMLFRSIWHKDDNVSPINFFFKVGTSTLVLLLALLTFLMELLNAFQA